MTAGDFKRIGKIGTWPILICNSHLEIGLHRWTRREVRVALKRRKGGFACIRHYRWWIEDEKIHYGFVDDEFGQAKHGSSSEATLTAIREWARG